ncbi:MAG: DNA mismatch repair endonuclease MutL [Elusimicrobiota bacterium]|jgi:DNA mismatch repair protein MutL
MPCILRLPEDVASRIAAGEVIERPSSVLKELIENSLDAGASRIDVEAEEAGKKLLRVRDDGCGMDEDDCRAAFERHATSKIASIEDLDTLATFGFRGEALYSIAAVARVSLISCRPKAKNGSRVEAEGGKILSLKPAPPSQGTTVEVRDLFFNVPARRKFLRSEATEKAQIARTVEDAALANPRTAFSLRTGPRTVLEYSAERGGDDAQCLRSRLGEVLGTDFVKLLLHAEAKESGVRIQAFLSPVSELVASRQLQFFFINRRPVSCRALQQALYRAYEPFRAKDRHPAAAIFVEIPAEEVDVNVHPQKREVRFRSERALYEALTRTFSAALLKSKGLPSLMRPWAAGQPSVILPAEAGTQEESSGRHIQSDRHPGESRDPAGASSVHEPLHAQEFSLRQGARSHSHLRWLGQIERTYLVFEAEGGLLVMDQHAAQERVFFERHLARLKEGGSQPQRLMLPIPVSLPASSVERLLERQERLRAAGFEVERFGRGVQVTAAPEFFEKAADVEELIHRAMDHFLSPGTAKADARYDAAATMACKAAVKAHDPLGEKEALRLARDLFDCEDLSCCPHGRPTMMGLDREELARRFKRSGAPPL